jgi:hypothetical protein
MEGGASVSSNLNKNCHLYADKITLLRDGKLNIEDKVSVLEHIGSCEECALTFSNSFTKNSLVEVPAGFQQTTINKLKSIPKLEPHNHKNRFLTGYTLRVGLAMCASLILVFSGAFNLAANLKRETIPTPNLSFMNTVTQDFKSFTDKIINMEVIKND